MIISYTVRVLNFSYEQNVKIQKLQIKFCAFDYVMCKGTGK